MGQCFGVSVIVGVKVLIARPVQRIEDWFRFSFLCDSGGSLFAGEAGRTSPVESFGKIF
jgi:hypothetical protein